MCYWQNMVSKREKCFQSPGREGDSGLVAYLELKEFEREGRRGVLRLSLPFQTPI